MTATAPRPAGEQRLPSAAQIAARATEQLASVTDTPRLEAELLLAHALGVSRTALLASLREPRDAPAFEALLERRLRREPIAYILGEWEFYSLALTVAPPLLVPRPETEHVVEEALKRAPAVSPRILDVGTGTGCLAVALAVELPEAQVTAVDVRPEALAAAGENARRHGVTDRVSAYGGDLFAALPADSAPFDLIVSNPPYVETAAWDGLAPDIRLYEDPGALLAGPEGLDVIRRLIGEGWSRLAPGGWLVFEMGDGQWPSVRRVLAAGGFTEADCACDLAGIPRVAMGRRPLGSR